MRMYERNFLRSKSLGIIELVSWALMASAILSPSQVPSQTQQAAPSAPTTPSAGSPQGVAGTVASAFGTQVLQRGPKIVDLAPAPWGPEPGAPGTGRQRASRIVLDFWVRGQPAPQLQV